MEGEIAHKQLKERYGKGHSYEADLLYEQWDKLYGTGTFSYSVYMLVDSTRPVHIRFNKYLEFFHCPFYVGYGNFIKRAQRSMNVKIQKEKYTAKTARLNEIQQRGGNPRIVYIGHFLTPYKAHLVERKIMNIQNIKSFLANSEWHHCEIPLTASDCNVIYNRNSRPRILKV